MVTGTTHPITHRPSSTRDALRLPERLEHLWEPQWGRMDGLVGQLGQLGLDTVDQPPQRDIDPARRTLLLEDPDVVRDLGDDVASQPKSIVDGQVGGEAAHQRERVLIGNLLLSLDVAEHESRHGLGFEDG